MGLANLVPGVSGGTMILAMGLYDRFIGALADVTRLRFNRASILFLGVIAVGAAGALVGLSGVAVALVTDHRWVMYSLFIGMTLGGSPELFKQSRPLRIAPIVAFLLAFAVMAALAWWLSDAQVPATIPVFVFMGVLGAASMILPGISGSYMLLIFGMYDVIIGSLSASALREDLGESLGILIPVGIGAVLGMGLLSNLLKFLLARYSAASHAALLGLLVGSVLGLWPFQEPVNPDLAQKDYRKSVEMILGGADLAEVNDRYGLDFDEVQAELVRETYADKTAGDLKQLGDELERFDPKVQQIVAALGLFLAGFALTRALGGKKKAAQKTKA
jgi:putative membrane protein